MLFRADPFGRTHELLPCKLLGGDLVKLFRKNKSKYYWYDFTVPGERYRGSTKETNETRAQKAAALKLAAAIKGSGPLDTKPPTLREHSEDFLRWVGGDRPLFRASIPNARRSRPMIKPDAALGAGQLVASQSPNIHYLVGPSPTGFLVTGPESRLERSRCGGGRLRVFLNRHEGCRLALAAGRRSFL